jgi:hypothetical protein
MTFLFSALDFGKSVMDAIVGWLSRQSPATLLCVVLCVALLIDHAALLMAHRHLAKVEKQLSASVAQVKQLNASREADRQAYAKAQSDAAQQNKAQVAQIEQQYQRNSDDERQAYLSDLAKLRASSVREQTPSAPSGETGSANPSAPSAATGRADGDGLQVHQAADVPTSEDAAEIELRLMHLQDWIEKQLNVDPNTEATAKPQSAGN